MANRHYMQENDPFQGFVPSLEILQMLTTSTTI